MNRMRKGTRACQECRRRKIKCTYEDEFVSICHSCAEYQRICIVQSVSDTSRSAGGITKHTGPTRLNVRVMRLESVVERLSRTIPKSDTSKTIEYLEPKIEPILPIYSLFQSEVLSAPENFTLPSAVTHSISFPSSHDSPREKLLWIISQETEILSVLSISHKWWLPFQAHYSRLKSLDVNYSLVDFVSKYISSGNTTCIAVALLCIATSLQTIRPGVDDANLYLSIPSGELMNKITASVDQVVLRDDEQISSAEGIVLLLLRGKHYAESNQLQKAWLCIRRAVLVAEKVGCPINEDDEAWAELVSSISETDLFFSMFLGMPCKKDDEPKIPSFSLAGEDIISRLRAVRKIAAVAAGEVNGRNTGPKIHALEKTEEIQNTLDTAQAAMSTEWWELWKDSDNLTETAYEALNAQFWFFQTQSYLNLPYMLQSPSDSTFLPKRTICLDASRNLIRIWIVLRTNTSFQTLLCRLDDFQGLISTIVILAGLLQGLASDSEFQSDIALIGQVKEVFRGAVTEQNGSIARQGLRVLDILSEFLQPIPNTEEVNRRSRKITLFIPYFGAIMVEPSSRQFIGQNADQNIGLLMGFEDDAVNSNNSHDMVDMPDSSGTYMSGGYEIHGHFSLDGGSWEVTESRELLEDWEEFMVGTELNQDWNKSLNDTLAVAGEEITGEDFKIDDYIVQT